MRTAKPRGLTLIEAMAAMGVMLIGGLGLLSLNAQGQKMNGDALRMTRATAIAQDLASQISLWDYGDARLANASTTNDADVGDAAFAFEQPGAPPADHGEADLTLGGAAWLVIPSADVQAGGYERYWNVGFPAGAAGGFADDSNANGVPDAMRIAVVVRWPTGGGAFRRVVLVAVKPNPAEAR